MWKHFQTCTSQKLGKCVRFLPPYQKSLVDYHVVYQKKEINQERGSSSIKNRWSKRGAWWGESLGWCRRKIPRGQLCPRSRAPGVVGVDPMAWRGTSERRADTPGICRRDLESWQKVETRLWSTKREDTLALGKQQAGQKRRSVMVRHWLGYEWGSQMTQIQLWAGK